MIVEDDASLRLVCRVNLELEGFRVREAASVEEGRAAVVDERPAVVFLDLHLGAGPSDAFLDELISAGVRVVLVSGTVDVREYEGRASEVIPKPFDPMELVAAARRHAVG